VHSNLTEEQVVAENLCNTRRQDNPDYIWPKITVLSSEPITMRDGRVLQLEHWVADRKGALISVDTECWLVRWSPRTEDFGYGATREQAIEKAERYVA
jgi:hypothetical protein